MEKVLESYEVSSEGIEAKVSIKRTNDFVFNYELKIPEIEKGTQALLDKIRSILLVEVPIKVSEIADLASFEQTKKKFLEKGLEVLNKQMPFLDEKTKKYLIGYLMQEMFGLGKIEFLLADPNLEEVVINGSKEFVWVYHKKYGWLKTNIKIESENEILNYANNIGRKVGRQITILNPLMDAHLPTGDRVNATLFPISTCGNTITIRKFRRSPWTIVDFIENKTLNFEVASWIWLAIQYELNMIVAGGTASGKTSLLNVFMSFIPPNHRVISIEDSVSGEEELIFKIGNTIQRKKIKDLFSDKNADSFYPSDMYVLSMDKNGRIEFKKVLKVMRHYVRKPLYEIILASGRKIKVTGDHSLFALSSNLKIEPIKVSNLRVGDRIAVPRKIKLDESIREINLLERLQNTKNLFVGGEPIKEFLESKEGRKFLIEKIPTHLRSKRRFYRLKGMLPLDLFKILNKEKNFDLNKLVIFKSPGKTRLPVILKLEKDIAFFFGCWLGDGCYDKNSIIITMSDKEFVNRLKEFCNKYGLSLKRHSDKFSFMINSSLLKTIMVSLGFVGDSFNKRVPEFIFGMPKELKAEFLKGFFSAEGWVKKYEVSVVSYSEDLIKDIQTLLLDFEIIFRAKNYKDKLGKKYYEGRISSIKFLKSFYDKIGFIQKYKNKKLESIITKNLKDVSDTIPLPKHVYKELGYIFGKNLAMRHFSLKSWYSRYKNSDIGREYLKKILQDNKENIEKITNPLDGKALINLVENDIFWDEIIEIKKEDYEGYVYDLSVYENENFVCNNIIAHNTRELRLPDFLHWVPLTTREANPEGLGEVSMLDLLVNSLRMRPDRIIVGEIRRAEEAEVLFEAMHTGHSVYATLHADTAELALKRLINPPINVPTTLIEALHLIAVAYRDRRTGLRRLLQLAEVLPSEKGPQVNILYRWKPVKDEITKEKDSFRVKEEIRMHTGMTDQEIEKDLEEKQKVLQWLARKKVKDINAIGRIVSIYYLKPDYIIKAAEKNEDVEKTIDNWYS